MNKKNLKYIYGPVPSWRLGSSLGIDLISNKDKICSFDCVYCQLGKTQVLSDKRKVFVSVREIIEELNSLPPMEIDYITFSGRGEPALAENIGRTIRAIKEIRKDKIAVITNASLLDVKYVRDDFLASDCVVAKLDASSQETLEKINRPMLKINFSKIILSLKTFRKAYKGKLALQVMFIKDNKDCASDIAAIARQIGFDEVQINTPLRACAVKPLSKEEIESIKLKFDGLKVVSVYDCKKKEVEAFSTDDTLKRRGKIQ